MSHSSVTRPASVESAFDIVVDIPYEDLETDPYSIYTWLREECPVAYVPSTGRVWVASWELCKVAGVNDAVFGPTQDIHEYVYGCPNIMSLTGDEHRVIRGATKAPVMPKQVNAYRDTMRATTRQYLEHVWPRGRADASREIFEPITQRVVGDVLGFTDVDDATLSRWLDALASHLADFGRSPEITQRADDVKAETREYLEKRLPDLVTAPNATMLTHLRRDGMPGGQLRPLDELIPTVWVAIVGGFQEPAHLVSSTLYGLLTNPDQLELVRADPGVWMRLAIEEGLRWNPPFGMMEKRTTADVTLGGVLIPAGTEIAMVIGSANRDPARFTRPDDFDITRSDAGNVSFGFGSHFCIGHHMARALAEVVLTETITTFRDLRLDPDHPTEMFGWVARGPKQMPVLWDAVGEDR
jgi:cytochrome P450